MLPPQHLPVITPDFVMSHNPCWVWSKGDSDDPELETELELKRLLGRGKTLRECLDIASVSDEEKIWLFTRRGACRPHTQLLFAAACAERVLPICEAHRPFDVRPRAAIQTVVRFALGQATNEEFYDASVAARNAYLSMRRGTSIRFTAHFSYAEYAVIRSSTRAAFAVSEACSCLSGPSYIEASYADCAAASTSCAAEEAILGGTIGRKREALKRTFHSWQVETMRGLLENDEV